MPAKKKLSERQQQLLDEVNNRRKVPKEKEVVEIALNPVVSLGSEEVFIVEVDTNYGKIKTFHTKGGDEKLLKSHLEKLISKNKITVKINDIKYLQKAGL